MGRLPFDPQRMAAAPQHGPLSGGGESRLTVSQLASLIEGVLRDALPAKVRVVGEVSGFQAKGHWYFSLKDAAAVIGCVMWESAARRSVFEPTDGQEVVLTGRVEFWGKGGRTQFYVERIEPVGAGALDLKFRQLCEELKGLGWFSPDRKRPVPTFPRRVAVITSRTGAALQDVLDTMRRRCPAVGLGVIDVRVQGDGAAAEIAAAIRWVSRVHAAEGIDAVLLTRGGGSKEDLWAFNERIVAEAVVQSAIPVVAAIGHETDTTIAELVADERCATPTQAAMRVTPDRDALREQIGTMGGRLASIMSRACKHERERLRSAARHPFFSDPGVIVADRRDDAADAAVRLASVVRRRVSDAGVRLERASGALERHRPAAVYARRAAEVARFGAALRAAMAGRLVRARAEAEAAARRLVGAVRVVLPREGSRVAAAERALELVGPISVLRRGFSVTLRGDGSVVRSIGDVRSGEVLDTRLVDGTVRSTVQGDASGHGAIPVERVAQAETARARRKAGRAGAVSKGQMDLFGG
ncbi:MAG: exodeoxyribonuclease VII large subunit [Phycisphaeraceae bacterium]|nr:exodeoxyribonuclease VII large subunit [Phycisphaeraceae bacterium]